jgi:hypothetical protein
MSSRNPNPQKQPTRDESSQHQTGEPWNDDSPLDPLKPKKKLRESGCLERSLGDAWKPLAEGSCQNSTGKDTLAEPAQLAVEDKEFEGMIPIYAAATISDDHEDGIDAQTFYKAATESPLADKCDTAMKQESDAIISHGVSGDFVQLPEGRMAWSSH